MNNEIRENLQELGEHIQAVGRQVASTKTNVEIIFAMRLCLLDAADTLDKYYLMILREMHNQRKSS